MGRTRVPLTWGQGLDRSSGILAEDSSTFLDLRNLLPRESKLIARGGLVGVGTLLPGSTDVVGGFPFRQIKGAILVGYNRDTRVLSVWRTDGMGGTPISIGDWATLPAGAPLPLVSGAESFNKFFLAHDEPLYNYRAKTVYYDPTLSPGAQIVELTADLDGDTVAESIRFRGVKAWLSYLCGYGYGVGSDENRPETMRVSNPGAPTTFDKDSYFLAGSLGEAITGLGRNGGRLRVNKKGEAHMIRGTGPKDFGIDFLEDLYGQLNGRLAVEVGDQLVFWSELGPRIATGGASVDIGIPLELDGPEPTDLTAIGPRDYGWSVYWPEVRGVIFGFPVLDPAGDKTRCYFVSMREAGLIKWSYFEIQRAVYAAWLVTEGAATAGEIPTGFADDVAGADAGVSGTGRSVNYTWDANALIGGEVAQIFAKPAGGAWALLGSGPAATEALNLAGHKALMPYDFAIRFIKDGVATTGYESSDPDDWTADTAADSKGDFVTTCSTPGTPVMGWSRTSAIAQKVSAVFTLAELDLGIRLYQSDTGVGGWVEVEEEALPFDTRTVDHDMADADLTTTKYFRVTAFRGALESTPSLAASRYIGPTAAPVKLALVQKGTIAEIEIWMREVGGGSTKLNVETSDDGATLWASVFSSATYTRKQALTGHEIALADTVYVRARFLTTAFGIDDAGPWVAFGSIFVDNSAVPAVPSGESGVWAEAENAANLAFADPGAGLGTFCEYTNMLALPAVSAVVPTPGVAINLSDIRDNGYIGYVPIFYSGFATIPVEDVDLYTVNTAGGRFKISAAVTVSVTMTMEGPTNIAASTIAAGLLGVSWDNGPYGSFTFVLWWDVADLSGVGNFLGPAVPISGPDDLQINTAPGYPAVPADGTDIKIRVLHFINAPHTRYSTYVDFDWTMGT